MKKTLLLLTVLCFAACLLISPLSVFAEGGTVYTAPDEFCVSELESGDVLRMGGTICNDTADPLWYMITPEYRTVRLGRTEKRSDHSESGVLLTGERVEIPATVVYSIYMDDMEEDPVGILENIEVIFDPTDGNFGPGGMVRKYTGKNGRLSGMPFVINFEGVLAGWYKEDGTKLTTDTLITEPITVKAKWTRRISTWNDLRVAIAEGGDVILTQNFKAGPSDAILNVPAGVTCSLDLNGYQIDRARTTSTEDGGVISVSGTFTLLDSSAYTVNGNYISGVIKGGYGADSGSGGITVKDGGVFRMQGGTISGNRSLSRGGGVYVGPSATFLMEGGKIENNECTQNGGGVYVDGNATVSGGVIARNRGYMGVGVYVGFFGYFEMSGGQIRSNSGVYFGGGVYVDGEASLKGGRILDNTAIRGGGIAVMGGTCKIQTGTVSGNFAYLNGGGIDAFSTVQLIFGTVSDNVAYGEGGGICVESGARFTMQGGTVERNAAAYGGGVSVQLKSTAEESGHFMMYGGSVCENTADYYGGGISASTTRDYHDDTAERIGMLTFGGAAKVTDNVQGGTIEDGVLTGGKPENLFMRGAVELTFATGPVSPTTGMSIGIAHTEEPTKDASTRFATCDVMASGYLFSDETSFEIVFEDGGAFLKLISGADFNLCNGTPVLSRVEPPAATWEYAEGVSFTFIGWFTARTGGTQITDEEGQLLPGKNLVSGGTYYAHWRNDAGKTVLTEAVKLNHLTFSVNGVDLTAEEAAEFGLACEADATTGDYYVTFTDITIVTFSTRALHIMDSTEHAPYGHRLVVTAVGDNRIYQQYTNTETPSVTCEAVYVQMYYSDMELRGDKLKVDCRGCVNTGSGGKTYAIYTIVETDYHIDEMQVYAGTGAALSTAICTWDEMKVTGGTLTAVGGIGETVTTISVSERFYVSDDAVLTVTGGMGMTDAFGIDAKGMTFEDDCVVFAYGGSGNNSSALNARGSMAVSGNAVLDLTGGSVFSNALHAHHGIWISGALTLCDNARVTLNPGSQSGVVSGALISENSLTISDAARLVAFSGVDIEGNLTVEEDGRLTVTDELFGYVFCKGNITVTGGEISASRYVAGGKTTSITGGKVTAGYGELYYRYQQNKGNLFGFEQLIIGSATLTGVIENSAGDRNANGVVEGGAICAWDTEEAVLVHFPPLLYVDQLTFDTPAYGTVTPLREYARVYGINFTGEMSIHIYWKETDEVGNVSWKETAPAYLATQFVNGILSIGTYANAPAGAHTFLVTNGLSETLEGGGENPAYLGIEFDLIVTLAAFPKEEIPKITINGVTNREGQSGVIDLATLGLTQLDGGVIEEIEILRDDDGILTVGKGGAYAFANVSTVSTATANVVVSSLNYQNFTVLVTFRTHDRTLLTFEQGFKPVNELCTVAFGTEYFVSKPGVFEGDTRIGNVPLVISYYKGTVAKENLLASAPVDAGAYVIVISVSPDHDTYYGSASYPFTITRKQLAESGVSSIPDVTYSGTAIYPLPIVKDGATVLVKDTDYTVAYTACTDVGEVTVTITMIGNYFGTVRKTFSILPKKLTSDAVFPIPDAVYTGNPILPAPEVRYEDTVLVRGRDYEVSYLANRNAGIASAVVSLQGNFEGTLTRQFVITPKPIADYEIPLSGVTYTGGAIRPMIPVRDEGVLLTENVDYVLFYTDNINAGQANVLIVFRGNYQGTAHACFEIGKRVTNITEMVADIADQTWNGSAIVPGVTARIGDLTLTEGVDYTVEYFNNVNVGTAVATVHFMGNIEGIVTKMFRINRIRNERIIDVSLIDVEESPDGDSGNRVFRGLTTDMEYADALGTEWFPVTDSTLTLPAGSYQIRYRGDASHEASAPVFFTVASSHTHDFKEWTVVKNPTCATEGIRTSVCACGETASEAIPKTEHRYEEGVCVVCGAELTVGAGVSAFFRNNLPVILIVGGAVLAVAAAAVVAVILLRRKRKKVTKSFWD